MTTKVTVDVNGRYRATVVQKNSKGEQIARVLVEGRYEGSPNPSGTADFWMPHPAHSTFEITEDYIGETE